MTEFELKLEVPAEHAEAVAAAFREVRRTRLQAHYFDTDKGHLARSAIVVRMRKEGSRWVQTAKANSGKALERLEHNVNLPRVAQGAAPPIDLARHAGTPLEARIRHALGLDKEENFPPVQSVFETDVQRQVLEVKEGRSLVEVAFDRGRVGAGDRSTRLCEVEFELKSGRPQDAIAVARRWCAKHKLWLSTVSKSAKGRRLAEDAVPAATSAQPVRLEASASAAEVQAAMIHNCLDQILANASDIADGSIDRDQVHQLRVGLRRLRGVLRDVKVPHRAIDPAWEPELAKLFRALGQDRDRGFLTAQQQPQLEAAGGPKFVPEPVEAYVPTPLAQMVRSGSFQRTLMELLAFVHREHTDAAADEPSAKALIRPRLKKLHRKVVRDGRNFVSLDEAAQHRVRKRLKRLRYLAELAAPLFERRKVERFLERLKPVQDSLGNYNDALMALHEYQKLSRTEPKAWFGVGWLSAGQPERAASCQRDLDVLRTRKTFW